MVEVGIEGWGFLTKKNSTDRRPRSWVMDVCKETTSNVKIREVVTRQEGKSFKGRESVISVLQISRQASHKRLKDVVYKVRTLSRGTAGG